MHGENGSVYTNIEKNQGLVSIKCPKNKNKTSKANYRRNERPTYFFLTIEALL